MRTLHSETRQVLSLAPSKIDEMFALYERFYAPCTREQFEVDLKEKTHVILLHSQENEGPVLRGFSTAYYKKLPIYERAVFLFSGDTVIEKEYWGTKALQRAFFCYLVAAKLRHPLTPVYWMLMSKGYRTYLMIRRNFSESYPQPDRAMPETVRAPWEAFYRMKYGAYFDATTGLIQPEERFATAVKFGMAAPQGSALEDENVRFFLERNPNYEKGCELACVGEVRFRDFFAHLWKYFIRPLGDRTRLGLGSLRPGLKAGVASK